MTDTEKLIKELEKHSNIEESEILTNKNGEKYRFIHYKLKYPHADNWLVRLFMKASLEQTGKDYNTRFASGDYTFYYDRPKFKNQKNGQIQMRKLEVLDSSEDKSVNLENKNSDNMPNELYTKRMKELREALDNYKERKVVLTKNELESQIHKALSDLVEYQFDSEDAQNLFMLVLSANKSLKGDDKVPVNEYLKAKGDNYEKAFELRTSLWDLFRTNGLIDRLYPLPIKYSISPNDVGLSNLFKNIVSQDDLRLNLIGVNIEGNTATGTDAHKMLHVVGERKGDFEDGTYIMSKYGSKVSGESFGKKIDVKYPNWKAVVPSLCDFHVIVNLPFLYAVLNNIYKNGLLNPITHQFVLKVKATGTDDNYFFGFNAHLMLELISALMMSGMKEAKMCFQGNSKAVIFTHPSVEWESYTKETILNENTFGLAMPLSIYDHTSTSNLIIDLKDMFLAEIKPYSLEEFYVTKDDIFYPMSSKEKPKKEVDKKNANDDKEFLKEKIKAFEDMLEVLTDGSQEKIFVQEKLDAFNDILDLYK